MKLNDVANQQQQEHPSEKRTIQSLMGYYGMSENYELKMLNGHIIVNVNDDVDLTRENLTSPLKITFGYVAGYFDIRRNKLTSFAGLPTEVGLGRQKTGDKAYLDLSNNSFTSLSGIHKHFKSISDTLIISGNMITSSVLGLLLIKNLSQIIFEHDQKSANVQNIINRHLESNRDINSCQEELIDAGLAQFARL